MSRRIYIFLIVLSFKLSFGQTFSLSDNFTISFPNRPDWKISTKYCDTIKNICSFLNLHKNIVSQDRKFSSISTKYQSFNGDIWTDMDNNGCRLGKYSKNEPITISGFKGRIWLGQNCNWLREDGGDEIAGYSIDIILWLKQDKYLRIMSSYFSTDKTELSELETDLLSLIKDIKISGQ